MPTANQLIRHGREEKRRTDRTQVLVFGLMVTRAKNVVHSVLFPNSSLLQRRNLFLFTFYYKETVNTMATSLVLCYQNRSLFYSYTIFICGRLLMDRRFKSCPFSVLPDGIRRGAALWPWGKLARLAVAKGSCFLALFNSLPSLRSECAF